MNNSTIRDRITKTIHKTDTQAEAYLFGSHARGDSRPDSDWDVLILVEENKVTNQIEDKFRDKLYDIEIETGQVISTFIYTKAYWQNVLIHSPFYRNIKKEGIRI